MAKEKFIQEYYYDEEFWHINTLPKSTLLNVELMGITHADASYYISRRSRWDMYVIEYVISGTGYINCNGKKYTVHSGDSYIIKSFTEHEYYADKQQPYQKIWANVSGALIDHLMHMFNLSDPVILRHVDLSEYFTRMHSQLDEKYDIEKLATIIFGMIFKISESANPYEKQNLPLAEKMRQHIDQNLNNKITTAEVAEHFHVTPIYASRVFKARYNQTINRYIINSTLDIAARWLKNSDFTIAEISNLLGYCNDNYFASQFKKYHGVSPKQYQLQYRLKGPCNRPTVTERNTDEIEKGDLT